MSFDIVKNKDDDFFSEIKTILEDTRGFIITNFKYMRQFYLTFQNRHSLCGELSWTYYRYLLKVEDSVRRDFYMKECINCNWSVRQLERQINSFYYERLLSSQNKELVRNEKGTVNKYE